MDKQDIQALILDLCRREQKRLKQKNYNKQRYLRLKNDPVAYAQWKAERRQIEAARRETNPELVKLQHKIYYDKMSMDPIRYARCLERCRENSRRARERKAKSKRNHVEQFVLPGITLEMLNSK